MSKIKFIGKIRKSSTSFLVVIPKEMIKEYGIKPNKYVKVTVEEMLI